MVSPRLVENPVGSPAESPSPQQPRALPVVDTALTGLSMASSVALARPSKSTGKIRWLLQWEFQDLIKCRYCMVPYHIRLYFLGIFLKWPEWFRASWHDFSDRDGHRSAIAPIAPRGSGRDGHWVSIPIGSVVLLSMVTWIPSIYHQC